RRHAPLARGTALGGQVGGSGHRLPPAREHPVIVKAGRAAAPPRRAAAPPSIPARPATAANLRAGGTLYRTHSRDWTPTPALLAPASPGPKPPRPTGQGFLTPTGEEPMIFLYTSFVLLLGLVRLLVRRRVASLERQYSRVARQADELFRRNSY